MVVEPVDVVAGLRDDWGSVWVEEVSVVDVVLTELFLTLSL